MVIPLAERGFFNWMNDEEYLKLAYRCTLKKRLDIKSPHSFTEKIQWLKINDRKDIYVGLVDKVLVKEYVAKLVGEEFIIPTLGVWDSPNDIDFDSLPDKFVLKCNHDSGSVIICRDKENFDTDAACKRLKKRLKKDPFYWGREWPYKYVKRKVFAEAYLENESSRYNELIDYKFYCFNGTPKYCQVITDRSVNEKIDFYDMEWHLQPFVGLTMGIKNSGVRLNRPKNFESMINVSRVLSKETYFSRIDLYEVNEKLYFSEITFYPAAGFGVFTPDEWDCILGEMLVINT